MVDQLQVTADLEAARHCLAEQGGVLLDLGNRHYEVVPFEVAVDMRTDATRSRYTEADYWAKLGQAGYDETLIDSLA